MELYKVQIIGLNKSYAKNMYMAGQDNFDVDFSQIFNLERFTIHTRMLLAKSASSAVRLLKKDFPSGGAVVVGECVEQLSEAEKMRFMGYADFWSTQQAVN